MTLQGLGWQEALQLRGPSGWKARVGTRFVSEVAVGLTCAHLCRASVGSWVPASSLGSSLVPGESGQTGSSGTASALGQVLAAAQAPGPAKLTKVCGGWDPRGPQGRPGISGGGKAASGRGAGPSSPGADSWEGSVQEPDVPPEDRVPCWAPILSLWREGLGSLFP